MSEQRWFAQEDLRIRLLTQKNGNFQGVVVEAEERAEGPILIADFPRATAPSLPIGTEVPLQFYGPSLGAELTGNGTIVLRSEDFFRQRYAFQVTNATVAPLALAIQQRNAVRVQPNGNAPVKVQLTSIDGAKRCEPIAYDVSATGISLRVPLNDERNFFDAWDVKVTLQLPDAKESTSFFGTIRSRRRLEGTIVLYGIEFDPAKTPDFSEKQEQVFQYVLGIQAETFRRARSSEDGGQPSGQAQQAQKQQPKGEQAQKPNQSNNPGPAKVQSGASADGNKANKPNQPKKG